MRKNKSAQYTATEEKDCFKKRISEKEKIKSYDNSNTFKRI